MNRRLIILIVILVLIVVLSNLSFIPGPSILYYPALLVHSIALVVGGLGIITIPVGLIIMFLERRRSESNSGSRMFGILLWVVPLTCLLSVVFLANQTRDFSRGYAISRAEQLIGEIDKYYTENGEYPEGITDLDTPIPKPGIIGIREFSYVKYSGYYEIGFTQNVIFNFNFEVVVYNKLGTHKTKGESKELYDTGRSNWKYYIYD